MPDAWVSMIVLTLSRTSPGFYVSSVQGFGNTMGKGEIACNEQFLLFSTVVSTLLENFWSSSSNLKFSSANSFSLETSKVSCLGKGNDNQRHVLTRGCLSTAYGHDQVKM